MAELVEDHLREAIVRVEGARIADGHDAAPVGRRKDVTRALDAKADAVGNGQPNGVERVQIDVFRLAFHVVLLPVWLLCYRPRR